MFIHLFIYLLIYSPNCLSNSKLSATSTAMNGIYAINCDDDKLVETHWIALQVNGNNVTYSDGFGVEYIPEEIKKFIAN